MTAQTFQPIAPARRPVKTEGPLPGSASTCLATGDTGLMTVIVVAAAAATILPNLLSWAVFRAAWLPDFDACRRRRCWRLLGRGGREIPHHPVWALSVRGAVAPAGGHG
jgi:hypothetical protein